MGILTRAVDLDTLNNILDLEAEDVGNQGRALLIMVTVAFKILHYLSVTTLLRLSFTD